MPEIRRLPTLLLLLALSACRSRSAPEVPATISTAEMLISCAASIDSEAAFIGEDAVVDALDTYRLDPSPDSREPRLRLARALVRVGRTAEALDLYEELAADASGSAPPDTAFIARLRFPRALACLRLGEQQNCVAHHTADSCLFPLASGAAHRWPRGSTSAIESLEAILGSDPENLGVLWLLNVAYMTLARYPDDVPEDWLIPESRYRTEHRMEPFVNVAGPLGVAGNSLSGGAVIEDFDGDGDLDLMASAVYPVDRPDGQLRYYVNNGDGTFTDATVDAGLEGIRGGLNIVHGDYDNNGYPDVFVLRGAWQMQQGRWPNTLLRNEGDGTFSDVTVQAGVLAFHPTQTAAWGDFDNDGWIDLFVGNETGLPARRQNLFHEIAFDIAMVGWQMVHPEVQGHLYHNNGDGTFTDIFPELDIDVFGWIKGVAWGDYNRDGRIDLYVSRFADRNLLFRNDGAGAPGSWTFTDVTRPAGVSEPVVSFTTWFWDYDNDGWLDIFAAGYPYPEVQPPGDGLPMELTFSTHDEVAEFLGEQPRSDESKPRLYRNEGDGTFSDVTREVGLYRALSVMGGNFGDLDNDGFLDMYLGTGTPALDYLVPNRVLRNSGGKRFQDVTVAVNMGHLQKGHGVAFGDIDGDGDQDVYVVMGGAYPGDRAPNALFENPGHDNDWITLRLEGTRANRSALGATIELTVVRGTRERTIHRVVGSGGSFGGSSLQQEIGIGEADTVRRLRVTWPDLAGSVEEWYDLEPNRVYRIRQGDGDASAGDLAHRKP